ncbi:MAG TPA: YdbL family protein [Dongiaceae bacterium]
MSKPSRSSDAGLAPFATGRRRLLLGLAGLPLLALGVAGLPASAQAQTARLLDAPRIAGLVGERYDGYAVARGKVDSDLAALIDKVNADRRAVYAKQADADKVPIEAVGKIYAAEIIKSAPVGTWFLGENGQWTQK